MSLWGRSDCIILRKMAESDRPNVLHPQAWALSDRPNRPPGGSRAFQMLRKAAHLPHGFAIWQDRAPYGSKWCPRLSMGSSFQKWCCGLHQKHVLAPPGPEAAIEGSYAAAAVLQRLQPLLQPCHSPATALLQPCYSSATAVLQHCYSCSSTP